MADQETLKMREGSEKMGKDNVTVKFSEECKLRLTSNVAKKLTLSQHERGLKGDLWFG